MQSCVHLDSRRSASSRPSASPAVTELTTTWYQPADLAELALAYPASLPDLLAATARPE